MTLDPYMKTLRIPVRLKDGNWELFHGGDFPKLKEGAMANLVIETNGMWQPFSALRVIHQYEFETEIAQSNKPPEK